MKLNICVCTLLQGQIYLQQKNACFAIWARVDTKFLDLSHHVLSMDDWPGDATFCVWGQPLKITRKNSAKKRSSPLDFIFDTCASTSSSHCFNVGEAEHIYLYPFAGTNVFKAKKTCFAIWERIDTICLNLLLMSDLCKFSIIIIISPFPKNKILVPNLVKSCKEPYPLKQSWVIFFLGSNGRMDAACANRWFQNY